MTISEPARREVLARLLKLNHERYAEEVKQGLHEKKKGRRTTTSAEREDSVKTLFDTQSEDAAISSNPDDVWYFAYGSNLWIDQKTDRTGLIRHGMDRPRIARLIGYRVAFNKLGSRGNVYANIVAPGDEVIGIVYRCQGSTLDTMDEHEVGYERLPVKVELESGESVDAIAYVAKATSVVEEGQPSASYLAKILRGAKQHGLPDEYVERIKRLAGRSNSIKEDDS